MVSEYYYATSGGNGAEGIAGIFADALGSTVETIGSTWCVDTGNYYIGFTYSGGHVLVAPMKVKTDFFTAYSTMAYVAISNANSGSYYPRTFKIVHDENKIVLISAIGSTLSFSFGLFKNSNEIDTDEYNNMGISFVVSNGYNLIVYYISENSNTLLTRASLVTFLNTRNIKPNVKNSALLKVCYCNGCETTPYDFFPGIKILDLYAIMITNNFVLAIGQKYSINNVQYMFVFGAYVVKI